jgi:hypothetical protein
MLILRCFSLRDTKRLDNISMPFSPPPTFQYHTCSQRRSRRSGEVLSSSLILKEDSNTDHEQQAFPVRQRPHTPRSESESSLVKDSVNGKINGLSLAEAISCLDDTIVVMVLMTLKKRPIDSTTLRSCSRKKKRK